MPVSTHTHTYKYILLCFGFDFIIPFHCVPSKHAQQPDTPIYLFSDFYNQPYQACAMLLHTSFTSHVNHIGLNQSTTLLPAQKQGSITCWPGVKKNETLYNPTLRKLLWFPCSWQFHYWWGKVNWQRWCPKTYIRSNIQMIPLSQYQLWPSGAMKAQLYIQGS